MFFADANSLALFERISRIVFKFLNVIFIYFITFIICWLFKNRKDPEVKKQIILTSIYFIVLMVFTILLYPGAWSWDDVYILEAAHYYNTSPWQHSFTGCFYILSLQIIPVPVGVMIFNSLFASLIVGYAVSRISQLFGKTKKTNLILNILLFALFFFPPMIAYILSGFRMGLYSYVEILLIARLIVIYKKKEKMSWLNIISLLLLTIVVGSWRSEAIYYPVLVFVVLLFIGKNTISLKRTFVFLACGILSVFSVGLINTKLTDKKSDYTLTATLAAIPNLIRTANENDKAEIDAINRVLNVQYMLDNPSVTGENCYWDGEYKEDYSSEDFSAYLKAYLKLCIKYPSVALDAMWEVFYRTGSGTYGKNGYILRHLVPNAINLYAQENNEAGNVLDKMNISGKYPFNVELRSGVLQFLCGTNLDGKINIIYNVFWNLFIPFALIILCLIYKIIKKNGFFVFLILTVCCRIPIIFITSSTPFFMYYLSSYICTYFLSALVIYEFVLSIIEKKKNKPKQEKLEMEEENGRS